MTSVSHPPLCGPATALVLAITLAAATQAHAGCTVSSSGMAFGVYQPLSFAGKLNSAAVNSTATVSVSCDLENGLHGYALKLGPSPAGNSIYPRFMSNTSGGDAMMFNVYTDATYLTVWGNGSTGGLITHGPLAGTFGHTVYGRIPAGQNTLKAGSFSSSLTITVTYTL